jgi:hypothetical protein
MSNSYGVFVGERIRITRVDAKGAPVPGEKSTIVTEGFIEVAYAREMEDGPVIEQKAASGSLRFRRKGKDITKAFNVTVKATGLDPEVEEMITGQTIVLDGNGNAVGVSISEEGAGTGGFALEVWTQTAMEGGDDDLTGTEEWYYFVTPMLENGVSGDFTINDGIMDCEFTANSRRASGWGVGPYNVANSATTEGTVTAAPLATPWGKTEHMRRFRTPVAPPVETDGAIALAGGSAP